MSTCEAWNSYQLPDILKYLKLGWNTLMIGCGQITSSRLRRWPPAAAFELTDSVLGE